MGRRNTIFTIGRSMSRQDQEAVNKQRRERHMEMATSEFDEISRALRRFAVLSNSGGVVSTLSFIGAMLGSSGLSEFELPRGVFWILVTYLVGLLLMLFELLIRRHLYSFISDRQGSIMAVAFALRMAPAGVCLFLSLIAAGGGTVSGLVLLYEFTGGRA